LSHELQRLLSASTVTVIGGGTEVVGFFIGPGIVLTELPHLWSGTRVSDFKVRTADGQSLSVQSISPVAPYPTDERRPPVFSFGAITMVKTDSRPDQATTDADFAAPEPGDPLLISGHGRLVDGEFELAPGPFRGPGLGALRLSADVGPDMRGAPIMNLRTGKVWGMLTATSDHPRPDVMGTAPLIIYRDGLTGQATRRHPANESRYSYRARSQQQSSDPADLPGLLFRLYIPAERLYAAEALKLLSLFRDWLKATRGHGVRQTRIGTPAGELIEFYPEDGQGGALNLEEQLGSFEDFLTLCNENPEAAVDALAETSLGRVASIDLVERLRRDTRRLEVDMRHERDRRVLALSQRLESELVDQGVELAALPRHQIGSLVERMVPRPGAAVSLMLVSELERPAPVNVQINQQFIEAFGGTIINSVAGDANLGTQPRELLHLIKDYGGNDAAALQTDVYVLEDPDVPTQQRADAKSRLQRFLGQISSVAKEVSTELLSKYLESKGL
jgi:hypothetical protein